MGETRPSSRPRTSEHDAALYDAVVVPRWSKLFSRMILHHVPEGTAGQVLDAGCATGHPAFELLRRMAPTGRVIAVDRDAGLVDLARRRALDEAGRRIFFKVEPLEGLSFGDEVFDLVVGNLVLDQVDDPSVALREMSRVLAPQGTLLLTRPLEGTFEEVMDMFREVALRESRTDLEERVDTAAHRHPNAATLASLVRGAGFDEVDVRQEELRLPFRSAQEMLHDRMLAFVAMPEWRAIAGPEADAVMQEVERCLDVYFGGGPLSLTVLAGLVVARKG